MFWIESDRIESDKPAQRQQSANGNKITYYINATQGVKGEKAHEKKYLVISML